MGVTTHVGQVWLTRGLALESAGRAMTVGYVQIVFAALWGMIFFAERPTPATVLGAACIILGTIAVGRPVRARAP